MKKMKKKGNAIGIIFLVFFAVAIVGGGMIAWQQGMFSSQEQTAVSTAQTAETVAEATKKGDIATIGVVVRDISQDDINTRLTTATYCHDGDQFIIDGTSASGTAEITGKTTYGKTITCYAFDSTHQTVAPVVVVIDEDFEHVTIDAYTVSVTGSIKFYDDGLNTDKNLTIPASDSSNYDKMRVKNNATSGNGWIPLGGIYLAQVASGNFTDIDMSGGVTLYGMDHSSANLVDSVLPNGVTTRKDNWDFVFEIDDDSETVGNQVLILEENDYLDTGAVTVTVGSGGCTSDNTVVAYAFSKGYYRGAVSGATIGYGHESDAKTPAVVSEDITGDTFRCV